MAQEVTLKLPDEPAATDEHVEVIVQETPPGPDGASAPAAAISDEPNVGLEELRRQLADRDAVIAREREETQRERNARLAAERRAQQSGTELGEVRRIASEAQYQAVVNGLASAQGEADALVTQRAKLLSDGNFDEAEKIGFKLSRLAARIETLEAGKSEYEAQKKAEPAPATTPPPQSDTTTVSPEAAFESWLAQQAPYNAAWIRQNKDRWLREPGFQQKAAAASSYAIDVEGIRAGTPEYFEFVETKLGMRRPATPATPATPAAPAAQPHSAAATAVPHVPPAAPGPATARAQAAPAAPPTRSAPPAPGARDNQNRVYLTPREMEICRLNDISPAAYARQREQLRAEGKIGTSN